MPTETSSTFAEVGNKKGKSPYVYLMLPNREFIHIKMNGAVKKTTECSSIDLYLLFVKNITIIVWRM